MTLLKSSEVFDHFGSAHQVSERTFFGLLAFFVTYGLAGTALVADYMMGTTFNPGTIVSLILGLAIPIAGIFVSQSDKWFISFIGYNMVLLPFGVILGPALRETDPDLIRNVAGITAMVTVIMGASGVMFPRFYSQIGGALFIALLGLVGVRILQIFVPALDFTWIDYISAGIFSLYIGYDMHRATRVERTVDNAVDIAISLYLDILNLFLSLLSASRD